MILVALFFELFCSCFLNYRQLLPPRLDFLCLSLQSSCGRASVTLYRPMGKKKKFIEKKKSATFQLLARDSSDPIYDTGPSSDRVFVRVDNNPYSINNFSDELHNDDVSVQDDPNSIFADAPGDYDSLAEDQVYANQTQQLPDHIRREILELGFPDDGYNYLAHLREIKNTGGGSAFYHNSKARLDQLPVDIKVGTYIYIYIWDGKKGHTMTLYQE